jgi:hypothetical protein
MTTEVDVQDLRDVIVLDIRINRFDRNERCVGDDDINTIAKVTAAWAMLICTATCFQLHSRVSIRLAFKRPLVAAVRKIIAIISS